MLLLVGGLGVNIETPSNFSCATLSIKVKESLYFFIVQVTAFLSANRASRHSPLSITCKSCATARHTSA